MKAAVLTVFRASGIINGGSPHVGVEQKQEAAVLGADLC